MKKTVWLLPLLFALFFSACSQNEGITYTAPTLEDDWSIKMTLSGGIAGVMQNIEVQSDGSYAITDASLKETRKGKLTKDELSKLDEMISSLEFNPVESASTCADCFLYQIEIESGGRKMIVKADDMTLGDSGIGELTEFLRGVMDANLK